MYVGKDGENFRRCGDRHFAVYLHWYCVYKNKLVSTVKIQTTRMGSYPFVL